MLRATLEEIERYRGEYGLQSQLPSAGQSTPVHQFCTSSPSPNTSGRKYEVGLWKP